MATVEAVDSLTPAWRGGFGRLWTAAVVSRFGDALPAAALLLLAAFLTDRPLLIASVTACGYLSWVVGLLGGAVATAWGLNTPVLLAAAFFVLSVLALIPARKPDVPVVAPHGDTTTAHVTR